MATLTLRDATVFGAGYDFSADLNEVGLDFSCTELDDSAFGDTFRSRIGGMADSDFMMKGWWQSASLNAPDPQITTNFSVANTVMTISPDGTDGSVAYFMRRISLDYSIGDKVDTVLPFSLTGKGSDGYGPQRGKLLKPKTTVSGNTNGTAVQLGAVSSTAYLYTSIHVFSAGTTCDVIVESDDNSGFTSGTTRSTTTVTAAGGTWVTRVAGAITDDWWRVRTANVTGSFSIAVAVGIR